MYYLFRNQIKNSKSNNKETIMSSVGSPKKPMSNLGRDIPRRMRLNSASQLPFDYCTTPGGTLFSTTPGGELILIN